MNVFPICIVCEWKGQKQQQQQREVLVGIEFTDSILYTNESQPIVCKYTQL